MGFWATLVNSIPEVVDWTIKNAGSLAKAAEAIETVFKGNKALLAAETGPNMLIKLHNDIKKAGDVLQSQAENKYKAPPKTDKAITSGPFELAALWPSPPSIHGPRVPPTFSADINKFLTLNELPTTAGVGENATDVGLVIAQQMFTPSHQQATTGDGPVENVDVLINMSGGQSLQGGHTFYRLPLGNPGGDEAWHSHIRLWHVKTAGDKAYSAMAGSPALRIKQQSLKLAADQKSHNHVKISIGFTGTDPSIVTLIETALVKVHKDNPMIAYKYWASSGNNWILEFDTPTNIGPGEVACAVSTAISQLLPKLSATDRLPRQPEINIVGMTTFIE